MTDPKDPRDELVQQEEEGRHEEVVHDPTISPDEQGQQEPAGGSESVPTGQSTEDMMEEISGDEPKKGQTIGDIVNEDDPHNIPPEGSEAREEE